MPIDPERYFKDWRPSFLERLIGAQRETIHSAVLAWLLETSELPIEARVAILKALGVELPFAPTALSTTTEWNDIDVIIETPTPDGSTGIIAIENKLKSIEHDDQLATYDGVLSERGQVLSKVFLTLVGDMPMSGENWRTATYADLLAGLEEAAKLAPDHRYLRDYIAVVERAVAACRLVADDDYGGGFVLMESVARESMPEGWGRYVDHCAWGHTLGRVWMASIGYKALAKIGSTAWRLHTGETNGAPLLNLERLVTRSGERVRLGLELQNLKIKAFASPFPYGSKACDAGNAAVALVLEDVRKALRLPPGMKPSTHRGNGFRSFTLPSERRKMTPDEMARRVLSTTSWSEALLGALGALQDVPST